MLALCLYALEDNIELYLTPTEAIKQKPEKNFRLGGLVLEHSITHMKNNIRFKVTDGINNITVIYAGVPPSLFKEKKGVIAIGKLQNKVLIASSILAKHDANYRPPNLKSQI